MYRVPTQQIMFGCVTLVPAMKPESVFVCVTAVQWFLYLAHATIHSDESIPPLPLRQSYSCHKQMNTFCDM